MVHLVLLGIHNDPDSTTAEIFEQFHRFALGRSPLFVLRRCGGVEDLKAAVKEVTEAGERIEILDIIDHAGPGRQYIGEEVLFDGGDDVCAPLHGAAVAAAISEQLTETCHVRLLGCATAAGAASAEGNAFGRGRLLLFKLARELGRRRIVFGTLRPTHVLDFTASSLEPRLEAEILFSSLAAIDGPAPDKERRLSNWGLIAGQTCF